MAPLPNRPPQRDLCGADQLGRPLPGAAETRVAPPPLDALVEIGHGVPEG